MNSQPKHETLFNNVDSKNAYLKLIEIHFRTSMFQEKRKSIHLLKDFDKKHVKQQNIKQSKKNMIKIPYKNTTENGTEILTLMEKVHKAREILPFEGIYDVLIRQHIKNDHSIKDDRKTTTENYVIPNICFDLIPDACNVCMKDPVKSNGASKTGIVTFLRNLNLSENGFYNSALIYMDEYTEYLIIRPTKTKNNNDVAMELFKIFTEFGPPERVYIRLFKSKEITMIMGDLFPSCEVIYDITSDGIIPYGDITHRVMVAIVDWMKKTKSDAWEIGCSVVQHWLNNTQKTLLFPDVSITPYNLLFNHSAVINNIDLYAYEPLVYVEPIDAEENDVDPLATNVTELNVLEHKKQKTKQKTVKKRDNINIKGRIAELNIVQAKKKLKVNKKKKKKKTVKRSVPRDDNIDDPVVFIHDLLVTDQDFNQKEVKTLNSETNVYESDTDQGTCRLNDALNKINLMDMELDDTFDITDKGTVASTSASQINERLFDSDDDLEIDFGADI